MLLAQSRHHSPACFFVRHSCRQKAVKRVRVEGAPCRKMLTRVMKRHAAQGTWVQRMQVDFAPHQSADWDPQQCKVVLCHPQAWVYQGVVQ